MGLCTHSSPTSAPPPYAEFMAEDNVPTYVLETSYLVETLLCTLFLAGREALAWQTGRDNMK